MGNPQVQGVSGMLMPWYQGRGGGQPSPSMGLKRFTNFIQIKWNEIIAPLLVPKRDYWVPPTNATGSRGYHKYNQYLYIKLYNINLWLIYKWGVVEREMKEMWTRRVNTLLVAPKRGTEPLETHPCWMCFVLGVCERGSSTQGCTGIRKKDLVSIFF